MFTVLPERPINTPQFLKYKPDRLKEKIIKACTSVASYLGLDFSYNEIMKQNDVIKNTYISDFIVLSFKTKQQDVNFTVEYEFPILKKLNNGAFFIKGYEYFIVKCIRETLWDDKTVCVRTRMIDLDIDLYVDRNLNFGTRYKGDSLIEYLTYLCSKRPELFEKHKDKLKEMGIRELYDKKQIIKMEKSENLNFNNSVLVCSLSLCDYVKEYCEDIVDLLIKTTSVACSSIKITNLKPSKELESLEYDTESGVTLRHKKIVNEEEILYNAAVKDIIKDILTKHRKFTKTKKEVRSRVELDPSVYMYNYIQLEQFLSPTAFTANKNKVTILTSNGAQHSSSVHTGGTQTSYTAKELDEFYRDIHSSQIFYLDPITTPDKDKTGINLWPSVDIQLDSYGRFKGVLNEEYKHLSRVFESGFENLLRIIRQREKGGTINGD